MAWKVEPTREIVRQFWRDGCEEFNCKSVHSDKAPLTNMLGWFADLLGVKNQQDWIDSRVICVGRLIFRPFQPGEAESRWPLWSQCVALVHELQHVVQYRDDPGGHFGKYALPGGRAHIEGEAYCAEFEFLGRMEGRTVPLSRYQHRFDNLSIYAWGVDEVAQMMQQAEVLQDINAQGALFSEPAKWAVEWFKQRQ